MYKQVDVIVLEHFDEQNHQYQDDEVLQQLKLQMNKHEIKVLLFVYCYQCLSKQAN
jgi:hypothetical protein